MNERGTTSLHYAAAWDDVTVIVKYIVSNGINVNVKDDAGQTALHWSALFGSIEVAKYLVSVGADVNAKCNNGNTPLHLAALEENVEFIKYLVSQGADINVKGRSNETLLHHEAFLGNLEMVKLLVSVGAEVNAKDDYGDTPLDVAREAEENTAIVEYLESVGGRSGADLPGAARAPVVMRPDVINFSRVTAGTSQTAAIRFYGFGDVPLELSTPTWANREHFDFHWRPGELTVSNGADIVSSATSVVEGIITVKPGLPVGSFQESFQVRTNYPNQPTLTFLASGQVVGGDQFAGGNVVLRGQGYNSVTGEVDLGHTVLGNSVSREISIQFSGAEAHSALVQVSEVRPAWIRAQLSSPADVGSFRIFSLTIGIPADAPIVGNVTNGDDLMAEIVLETNDATTPVLRMPLQFTIERVRAESVTDATRAPPVQQIPVQQPQAGRDVAFYEAQLAETQRLVEASVTAAQESVERVQRLVALGVETDEALAEAQAELEQVRAEGRAVIQEARADLIVAREGTGQAVAPAPQFTAAERVEIGDTLLRRQLVAIVGAFLEVSKVIEEELESALAEGAHISDNLRQAQQSGRSEETWQALQNDWDNIVEKITAATDKSRQIQTDMDIATSIMNAVATQPLTRISGVVTEVRPGGVVEVYMGSDSGLERGQRLDVLRSRDGDIAYIGRIEVTDTTASRAIAHVLPVFRRGVIQNGDDVIHVVRAR